MGLFTDGFKLLKKASEPLYKTPKSKKSWGGKTAF